METCKHSHVKASSIKEAHRNSIWGIHSRMGPVRASWRLHARNLLWTIDKGGSVEATMTDQPMRLD